MRRTAQEIKAFRAAMNDVGREKDRTLARKRHRYEKRSSDGIELTFEIKYRAWI